MALPYMPIMHDQEITVLPFAMFKPYENQAQSNHWQSLEQLAKRGGLSLCEAVAILENRKWRDMSAAEARARIVDLRNQHRR